MDKKKSMTSFFEKRQVVHTGRRNCSTEVYSLKKHSERHITAVKRIIPPSYATEMFDDDLIFRQLGNQCVS